MTNRENLLVTAMEECNELSMAISKALRFGMNNYCVAKGDFEDNNYHILEEYTQLKTVMDMLFEREVLEPLTETVASAIRLDKENKVKRYQEYSKNIGLISD